MALHQANSGNNDSSNVGYSRLIDGIATNGGKNGGGCCNRKHQPWQLKLIFILIGVLLASWLAYYLFTNNSSTFLFQSPNVQRQSINSFTYGKSDSKFYESGFNDYVGTEKLHKFHNITKNVGSRRKTAKKFITECKLPRVNPWDPAIEPYLDPTYYMDWAENCKREYPELTKLVDGYVVLHPEAKSNGTNCQFRCLLPHTDYEFIEGNWKEINEQPDCDIVETRCRHKALQNNEFYYNYLHAQIYRRLEYNQEKTWNRSDQATTPKSDKVDIERTPNLEDANRRAPDVHVIVIDSVSHTQFLRTHPKTVMWLRERMGAIPFPHLNKIGLNSRPNGYGLFLGIQAYPVSESPMGEGYTPPRDLWAMGGIYLDHEPFVGFEYREKNYRTMMAEDWGKGVFNWPSNYGFERQPVEHYMRPFQLRAESHPDKLFNKNIHDKSCREPHHDIMEYLTNFINAYEEQPKFSISWMSEIGHNYVNGPYRLDKVLFKFPLDYEMKLNNSFVLIMGDHGLRFGGVRQTKPGEIEDNNPAFFLTLPAHLRYNDNLVNNLRHNSRQLITHFDIHATLVNIARQTNMTVHSPFLELAPELKGPTPFGESLLYPFNTSISRNCATLKIPFEFCQCQFETKNLTETAPKLGMNLAQTMVTKMNADLAEKDADEKCAKLEVNQIQPVEIIEFEPNQNIDVFKVTYETIPGNGKFWGYMKVLDRGQPSQNYTFISTRFSRMNEYKAQSYCTEDYTIGPYCYCKELLKATMTTTTESPDAILKKMALSLVNQGQ